MTAAAYHVRLERPLQGVTVSGASAPGGAPVPPANPNAAPAPSAEPVAGGEMSPQALAAMEQERLQIQQTRLALDDLITKVTRFHEEMLSAHRKEIARLAVEIARKVLMQQVKDGDYEIEQIIQEALKNAPVQQDVVVHLHPEDLVACQSLQQEGADGPFSQVQLVGDPTVNKAECLLETPKGVVKSFIEDHLDKIREALERAN